MEGWEGPLSVAYLRLCLIKRVLKRGGANLHVSYQSQGGGGGKIGVRGASAPLRPLNTPLIIL